MHVGASGRSELALADPIFLEVAVEPTSQMGYLYKGARI